MDNREESVGLVLPNSTEAEISVLGAMLQDSSAVLRAAEQLVPDDFFHPETKIRPPCDFFDLFDGASGMIQLDRLMPEPLVPPEGGNANAPQ